jgi:hypothetical protein
MSEKTRQKKDGERKEKKNERRRAAAESDERKQTATAREQVRDVSNFTDKEPGPR